MPPAGPISSSPRIQPDYALIHQELKRKGVTLQLLWEEYLDAHRREATYRYTQFCQREIHPAQTRTLGEAAVFRDRPDAYLPPLEGEGMLHIF